MENNTIIENCTVIENHTTMETPIGRLIIKENGKAITAIYVERKETRISHKKIKDNAIAGDVKMEKETSLLKETKKQLQEYFDGKRKCFDLPLQPNGTAFQQKVWQALRQIPYGETRSYKELADMIGSPNACRAVGGANHKNPILILTPCHRVIGTDGSLTGFAAGLPAKKYLLELEKGAFK